MAADDLDAPLGTSKKRKSLTASLPVPQLVAGALGLSVVAVGLWTVLADDPYGGEPIAVVATRMSAPSTARDQNVAAAARTDTALAKAATTAADGASPPPGSKVITITDGSTGKIQQIAVPPKPGDSPVRSAGDPKLLEESRHGKIPRIADDGTRAAMLYAHPVMPSAGKADAPRIAIIVGGLGVSASATGDALEKLPGPVTLAFAPYGTDLEKLAERARSAEHEILIQAPMEPFDYPDNDPGPQTLLTSLAAEQNVDRLQWLMARMQGYVGITNYMGARFTASDASLGPVLREIAKRGLIYVDDGSSSRSVAGQIAGSNSIPFAKADLVLDAVPARAEIDRALARLEMMARERGSAIGYATGTAAGIARIAEWAKNAAGRGFVLVPVSMVAIKPKSS